MTPAAPTRVFIHGLEGSSQGTKSRYLRQLFPDLIPPDFKGQLAERMVQLETLLESTANLVLIGSSLGGLMAAIYTCQHPERMHQLILLDVRFVNPVPVHSGLDKV